VFQPIFEKGYIQIKVIKVRNLGIFLGKTYVIEDRILSWCLDVRVYTKSDQKIRLRDA